MFQEMSSRPTTIVDMNLAIAYGLIEGHCITISDAIKAYVQSFLSEKPLTYLEMPKYLCPPEWAHMKRPCVRLIKALYGHPEAGGLWERHLTKIVIQIGGVPVENHPSCFWFAELKLLLIIYVDDLLLAGPSEHHEAFWKKLGALVTLGPPEPMDRYLGRHHVFEECPALDLNLFDFFKSPVEI